MHAVAPLISHLLLCCNDRCHPPAPCLTPRINEVLVACSVDGLKQPHSLCSVMINMGQGLLISCCAGVMCCACYPCMQRFCPLGD